MKEINLSDLAGIWFHDVQISRISVDYIKRQAEFEFTIPVGWWNSPNRRGLTEGELKGTLLFTKLLYFVMEPPAANYPYEDSIGIEITSEGPATPQSIGQAYISRLPQDLPPEAFLHYFFVNEWNAFIFVAATNAVFRI
ncbi:MAG: hypothetical protein ACRYFS_05825 [Janthinobacterium lividum]